MIQKFATFWFDMNKVQDMLQLDTPKQLVALVFVLQHQALVPQI
jgi:hypothetical protein